MAFVRDQYSVQINGVIIPLVSTEDAVTIPQTKKYERIRTDAGNQLKSNLFEEAPVKLMVVRGGKTEGGFMSDAMVAPALRRAILEGNVVTVKIFANDGSGRSMQGEATCTRGDIKAKNISTFELEVNFTNPELLNNLFY